MRTQGYISNFTIRTMVVIKSTVSFTVSNKFSDYFIEDSGTIKELMSRYDIRGNEDHLDISGINGRICEFDPNTNSFIRYI